MIFATTSSSPLGAALSGLEGQVLASLFGVGGAVDPATLETIADLVYEHPVLPERLDVLPPPAWLLKAHGVRFRPGYPLLGDALRCGEVLVFRWPRRPTDPQNRALTLLQTLAESLLAANDRHDERDVWRFTLALVLPQHAVAPLRRGDDWDFRELRAFQPHVPDWAVRVRLTLLRDAARRA